MIDCMARCCDGLEFKGSDTNYGEAWLEWFSDVLSSSVSPRGAFEYVRTAGVVQVGLAVAMFVKN